MTEDQIKNWRCVIFTMLEEKCEGSGAYALIMPIEEIEEFRDMLQDDVNKLGSLEEFCNKNSL
jgi:hypothetical protein